MNCIPDSILHFELTPQIISDYKNFISFREEFNIRRTFNNKKNALIYLDRVIYNKKRLNLNTQTDELDYNIFRQETI